MTMECPTSGVPGQIMYIYPTLWMAAAIRKVQSINGGEQKWKNSKSVW